jgi:hypothetical protein
VNARLALWMSSSGRESTSSERLQLSSHICVLERNPIVVASGRAAETSKQMQAGIVQSFSTQTKVRTESSRYSDE